MGGPLTPACVAAACSAPLWGTQLTVRLRSSNLHVGEPSSGAHRFPRRRCVTVAMAQQAFQGLGLSEELLRSVKELSWDEATEVQQQAIPAILRGDDVWAEAPTGSGKTAAFALPILQRVSTPQRRMRGPAEGAAAAAAEGVVRGRRRGRFASVLVLSPTRELAVQTAGVFSALGESLSLRTMVATGGVSINPILKNLGGGTDVLVATPGRLLDIVNKNALSLECVDILVLDEADKLLGADFGEELEQILGLLPPLDGIQTALFSATFPFRTRPKAEALLTGAPVSRIRLGGLDSGAMSAGEDGQPGSSPDVADFDNERADASAAAQGGTPNIEHRVVRVDEPRRTQLLIHLYRQCGWERMLVFVGSQYKAEHVAKKLRRQGIAAASFHGGLSQGARTGRLEDFRASLLKVLIVTDVAARGIDIEGLPAVLNYDLPRSVAGYKHRAGRVGRAGASGVALSFVTSVDDEKHFELIERRQDPPLPRLHREVIDAFEPDEEEAWAPEEQSGLSDGLANVQNASVPGVEHSHFGLAHDRLHGGVKGRRKSKKDKLREQAASARQS